MENYIIVSSQMFNDFEKEVNDKIKEGYIPLGGVSSPVRDKYAQAMILSETKIKERATLLYYNKGD